MKRYEALTLKRVEVRTSNTNGWFDVEFKTSLTNRIRVELMALCLFNHHAPHVVLVPRRLRTEILAYEAPLAAGWDVIIAKTRVSCEDPTTGWTCSDRFYV